MNASIAALVCAPFLVTGPAAQSATRMSDPPRIGSRRPVDVSLEGLGGMQTSDGPSPTPFDCPASILDQAGTGCLQASSSPTQGMLLPYPGKNNTFGAVSFVGGGEYNRAAGPFSAVGGGQRNTARGTGSTVGGGRQNTTLDAFATVGGGDKNTAPGPHATVGGGLNNTASGSGAAIGGGSFNTVSGYFSTVGGGLGNTASGEGGSPPRDAATVAGGAYNTASGAHATIAGGRRNWADGASAAVPGGVLNTALGDYSFAAGLRAKADHNGAFVWGDSQNMDKPSSAADEFNVYASGGVRLFTNSAATTGVLLAPGGSTWTMVSDRDAKENVEPVDARAVLDEVARLPLATWNYKDQDDSIRHMGPMAQDFYAAFGLGLGEKTIDAIDPNGVALAAIQGLNELVQDENAELKARLAEKEAEIDGLREQIEGIAALPAELAALESRVAALAARLEDRTAIR